MDFESILSTNSNTPAGGPNSNGQLFGPTNVSRNPTSPRRATEMMRGAGCRPCPVDLEPIEGIGDDGQDFGRSVGEHVPRVSVMLDARRKPPRNRVDVSVAIGVDETANQGSRMGSHDVALPGGEFDLTLMLAARAVQGEHTRPVLPVGVDIDAPSSRRKSNGLRATDYHDVGGYLIDYVGIAQIAGDSEGVDPLGIKVM